METTGPITGEKKPMMKRLLSILLTLVLLAAPLCAPAEGAGETAHYTRAWVCGAAYGYDPEVSLLVLSDDPGREGLSPEEVRFCPFDEASGLYVSGEGEPAGDRAEVVSLSGSRNKYAVRLKEPGKYLFSGAVYYLLDGDVPAQAALRAELDGALAKCARKGDKKTAKALHDWLVSRISPVFPAEDAERLSAFCGDPMNALLTGYACREAYAELNSLLLNAAGVRCLTVSGTAGEEAATWNLWRQDGAWCWTDAALDDVNDKKGAKYFALDDKAVGKDHALCASDEAFTAGMVRSAAYDALLNGTLDPAAQKVYPDNLWHWNYDFLVSDGPAWVVGGSATVTFRLLTNDPAKYAKMTPEQFLEKNMEYCPWLEEEHYYYSEANVITDEMYRQEEIPPLSELITVESAAEDLSSMTLTFRVPGEYIFFNYSPCLFYLISPDQAEPAALAAEMDELVAKAKEAKSEKETANKLFQWTCRKVKYNMPAWHAWNNPAVTARDVQTSGEAFGALLYGKAVCGGYADIFHVLMQQAGLVDFITSGNVGPEMEGHVWNVSRLDGVWYHTDPTWSRFAWTREKMCKDREVTQEQVFKGLFFGSAFDLLAGETEADRKHLAVVPLALKYLPRAAEGYGFPADLPDLIEAELATEGRGLTVTLSEAAWITVSRQDKTIVPGSGRDSSGGAVTAFFTAKVSPRNPLRVEIRTYDESALKKLSKPVFGETLEYEAVPGARTSAVGRYVMPCKSKDYPGYETGYRFFEYDEQKRPVSAGWHLARKGATLDIQVFFDAEGNAARYAGAYSCYMESVDTTWEALADGTVISLGGKEVKNPDKADPTLWEPIWFE